MEFVVIFAIGWVASHAFGEKRDEYERSQDAHREKYMQRLAQKHPNWSKARQARYLQNAARRNALGHFAYLLRHGWSSTFNDFAHGWSKAKDAHEEWKADRPEKGKKPGFWATFKAGWKDQWARRPKATGYYEPRPDLTPESKPVEDTTAKPDASTSSGTSDDTSDAEVIDWPGKITISGFGIGVDDTTPQTPGNTAGSTNRRTAVEFNYDRTKTEMNGISEFATRTLSVLEQIIADAIAGDMNKDPETMSHLASLQEALSNTRAHATAVAGSLTKHTQGQEYANTGHAASTDYLRSN